MSRSFASGHLLPVVLAGVLATACGTAPPSSSTSPEAPSSGPSNAPVGGGGASGRYVGIPDPPFGVVESRPAPTHSVTSFPSAVGAGQVIEVSGEMSGENVTCSGTASNPGWIVGGPGINITSEVEVYGSHCILDGLKFTSEHYVALEGDHIALRNSESIGVPYEGPSTGVILAGSDIVAYRNRVHDHGNLNARDDQDAHGIGVDRGALRVWILENELYRNSGDGVQVNPYPYDSRGQHSIRFVYIGRNKAWGNKQTGIWIKMSDDVVVSQNEIYDHRPSNSSAGQCTGYQYGTERAWFLYNNIHDCSTGIYVAGDGGYESESMETYIVGNRIHDLFPSSQREGVWSDAAIRLTGGREHLVVANNMSDVPSGIHVTRTAGLFHGGNTFSGLGPGGEPFRSDDPVREATAESVYATFQRLYGLDIRPGAAGVAGIHE